MSDSATTVASSGVTPKQLQDKIERELEATYVHIRDDSGGCGQKYEVTIVSGQFEKMRILKRHQHVNGKLKDEIAAIHAWSIKCHTPEEWERKKPQ